MNTGNRSFSGTVTASTPTVGDNSTNVATTAFVHSALSSAGASYTTSFTNTSLSSNILTVTHNLGTRYISVTIYDNNNNVIIPSTVTATSTNALTVDLTGFTPLTGTWNVICGTGPASSVASSINLTGTYASLPAASTAGRTYRCTDSLGIAFDTGTAWQWYVRDAPVTPPPSSGWSWVNQGAATLTQQGLALVLTAPPASSEVFRVVTRPVIASSGYTVTLGFIPFTVAANYTKVGLYLTDGSKSIIFCFSDNSFSSGDTSFDVLKYTTQTGTYSSTAATVAMVRGRDIFWLRITDDGTNRKYFLSPDGLTWPLTLYSAVRTDFLVPTQYGLIACSDSGNVIPASLKVVHWTETTP